MKLIDYIKKCLKNIEFRKYWEEDFGEDFKLEEDYIEELSVIEALEKLNEINKLFESEEEYATNLDNLIKNKGVKSQIKPKTQIDFYQNENKCPVLDFLEEIKDEKLKQKTVRNIYLLSQEGNKAKEPLVKYIDSGIWELRTQQGNNIDRIFYFFIFGDKIIMTNGYIKKTQKLDKKEFEKAKKYMNNYLTNR